MVLIGDKSDVEATMLGGYTANLGCVGLLADVASTGSLTLLPIMLVAQSSSVPINRLYWDRDQRREKQ